jgi:hypothetical protein
VAGQRSIATLKATALGVDRVPAIRFRVLGVPVEIRTSFLLLAVVLGLQRHTDSLLAVWIVIATAAVLAHEAGHAAAFRAFGIAPSVVLHGGGGQTAGTDPGIHRRIVLVLAGPTAGVLLGVMAGPDPADATSSSREVPDYLAALDAPVRDLRIGVPENYYFDELQPEVERAVREAITALGSLGARVEALRVPDPGPMVAACNNTMVSAEAAAIHSRVLKERPGDLQPAVLARLAPGLRVSAYDYLQGSRLRAQLTREFIAEVFAKVDVLVAPTIPEPALALAEAKSGTTEDVVGRMGRFSRLTRPFNALGLPVLSVPCGFGSSGLPLSVQLVGRPFDEASVLRLGHAYEQASPWHTRVPTPD